MNSIERYFKFFVAIGLYLSSYDAFCQTIICHGRQSAYRFSIEEKIFGKECFHEMKIIKDEHDLRKKTFELSSLECWKIIAKIQMDEAKCCVKGKYADFGLRCEDKKMSWP